MALINKKSLEICHLNGCSDYKEDDYFEVDEFIAPIIVLLIKKGYKTSFCCSGHMYGVINELTASPGAFAQINDGYKDITIDTREEAEPKIYKFCQRNNYCYLAFEEVYEFQSLPEGFVANISEHEYRRLSIKKDYSSLDGTFERAVEIVQAMKELYAWVLLLKPIGAIAQATDSEEVEIIKVINPGKNEFCISRAEIIKEIGNIDFLLVKIQYQNGNLEQARLLIDDDTLKDISGLTDLDLCYYINDLPHWD